MPFKKGNQLGKKTQFKPGNKHPNWRGGIKIHYSGSGNKKYRWVKNGDKYVAEHRLVMERFLGRKLCRTELIHHKDSNTFNNDIENLEILSQAQHNKIHGDDKRKYRNFICKCGNTNHWGKGMCRKCYDRQYYIEHKEK